MEPTPSARSRVPAGAAHLERYAARETKYMDDRQMIAVFLPHNEPYLGNDQVLAFDLVIPPALESHAEIAQKTFGRLTPLQVAATEIRSMRT